MSKEKETNALGFANNKIEGINEFEKMTGQRPPVYLYLDNLVEIQQALLKGQEFKKDNERLYQDIYDLRTKNAKYKEDLYYYSEMLDNVEKENTEYKRVLEILFKKNVNIIRLKFYIMSDAENALERYNTLVAKDMVKPLTKEEFELLKRYFEKNIQKR